MCCGRQQGLESNRFSRVSAGAAIAVEKRQTLPAGVRFEYIGKTALTVVGPVTGKRYRFRWPGECLEIDVRDRSWIAFVPHLRRAT